MTSPPFSHRPPTRSWGWADVGFHRDPGFNETKTPNMDALVKSGVLLNQYYVHKYCSPSRSSYQSGRLPIHVYVFRRFRCSGARRPSSSPPLSPS